MFFTREVWCIADVLSVGPSSEQTANAQNISYTPNLTCRRKTWGGGGGGVVLSYSLDGGVPLGSRKSYPLPD